MLAKSESLMWIRGVKSCARSSDHITFRYWEESIKYVPSQKASNGSAAHAMLSADHYILRTGPVGLQDL
jgi:hypothetical protein